MIWCSFLVQNSVSFFDAVLILFWYHNDEKASLKELYRQILENKTFVKPLEHFFY